MGVMTRSLEEVVCLLDGRVSPRQVFVITSDFDVANPKAKTAPKRLSETYQVWTGRAWSATTADALKFPTLDAADDYVRDHYTEIMKRDVG